MVLNGSSLRELFENWSALQGIAAHNLVQLEGVVAETLQNGEAVVYYVCSAVRARPPVVVLIVLGVLTSRDSAAKCGMGWDEDEDGLQ